MTLKLIVGPPNSGRAGVILQAFLQTLDQRPVLVVPTADHAVYFERLLAAENVLRGGSVVTFNRLFSEIAAALGVGAPSELSDGQRLHLMREVVKRSKPRILASSAARPGFPAALAQLIAELQAGNLDPASVHAAAGDLEDGAYLNELAELFGAYVALRDELGRGDAHVTAAAATAALKTDPAAWSDRPVYLYGFDDLTGEQLAAVEALAKACEVTVAVTFEDREALAERSRLLNELRDLEPDSESELKGGGEHTDSAVLRHLDRHVFEPGEQPRCTYDDGLVLLEAAGERAEAEQIGGEIARLLADGTNPGSIGVVLRDPQRSAALYRTVFESYAIPVAVDARLPFAKTSTGAGLLGLLRAALDDGSATDFMSFMRTPARTSPGIADSLELAITRGRVHTAEQAMAPMEKPRWEVEKLRAARRWPALLDATAEILRSMAEYPWDRAGRIHDADARLELAVAGKARALLADLADLEDLNGALKDLIAALEGETAWLAAGDAEGRVRVLDPYRVRAGRFSHVFVASLQQGEFPRSVSSDPFLSDEQRGTLLLPPRTKPEAEERYLFHACVSRPTERLYLSYRTLDEDGGAIERSPFIDDVARLVELDDGMRRTRALGDVVFAPDAAPSERELVRSRAAFGPRKAAWLPGPLRLEPVLAELSKRDLFGASTLESYLECSYRWFIDHDLNPKTLEPTSEPLDQGSVVHAVLEQLYREAPGGKPLPTSTTLDAWRERARELLDEQVGERGLEPRDAATRAGYERMLGLTLAFLAREASADPALLPDAELLEASFGVDPDGPPAMELRGGGRLHGMIDRIDVAESDEGMLGLVRDYKLSRSVTPYKKFAEKGKLQLPLYAIAARRVFGVEPVGGLYMPLGATDAPKGRGLLDDGRAEVLEGVPSTRTDRLSAEEFAAALEEAEDEAARIIAEIRAGKIGRNPIGGQCPRYCTFQAICRRERASLPDPEDDELEEAASSS